MKIMIETKYDTIFDISEMYDDYSCYEAKYETSLSDFLEDLESEYELQEEYEKLIAFRKNRERIYNLLTEERKRREGPPNLEE